jgi:ATP-binding cassette, subfamily B, multidrug efflux pump
MWFILKQFLAMSKKNKVSGKAFDYSLFRRVMSFAKPYKKIFYLAVSLTFLLAFFGVVRPLLLGKAIDIYVIKNDKAGLLNLTIFLIVLLLLEAVVQFYQTFHANLLGQSVTNDIRSKIFKHIINFRLRYFDKTPIGTLVTRVISDIETIADIFSSGLLTILGDILKLTVVILVMFFVNWKLALYSMAPIPVLLFATYIFKNAIKKAFQQVRTQVAKLNTFVQEHITGISIIQTFTREEQEFEKFQQINREHRDAHIKSVWAYSVFFPVVEILSAISLALIIWWGVRGVIGNEVTFGDLVAYIIFINMMYRPIRQLADNFNVLQMGMVGSERVFSVLDTNESIENFGNLKTNIVGNIKFENISFAYIDQDYVLNDISFEVKAGQTIAFVGATGAGKTSVINLLSRFYDYQKGDIFIDNKNLKEYDLDYLRQNISTVLQDVFLFSDTIYNNITLLDKSITRDKVIEASKLVGAHDFIMQLPANYDYDVKERGGMLSVGQRQLLSFIRAYVYNPKILVLDEATSSVDTESELLIQSAIDKLTVNRTSIVIAHRLSTVQKADKIIVMENGRIVEMGSHQELILRSGYYKTLFDLQFKS